MKCKFSFDIAKFVSSYISSLQLLLRTSLIQCFKKQTGSASPMVASSPSNFHSSFPTHLLPPPLSSEEETVARVARSDMGNLLHPILTTIFSCMWFFSSSQHPESFSLMDSSVSDGSSLVDEAQFEKSVVEGKRTSVQRLATFAKWMERKKVLVVGGSGYLGQHLLVSLSSGDENSLCRYHLAFTHHRPSPPENLLIAVPHVSPFRVDLQTGKGLDTISNAFGQPDVIVNCGALSVPRACELDPDAAMATNSPATLVNWLSGYDPSRTLLIHLSTDQVYEGLMSFYKEDDDTIPVNMYGKSKLAAEKFIMEKCKNFAILRSSIIYGPQTVAPVAKSLPIQWIDSNLSSGREVGFFDDEFRCPIHVNDVVDIIISLITKWTSGLEKMSLLLNVGGPDRVSRVQMAMTVASVRGYDLSLIKPTSASLVDRGVISPADISMDITRLTQELGMKPVPFKEGVRLTLQA